MQWIHCACSRVGACDKTFNRMSALTTWCRNLSGITLECRASGIPVTPESDNNSWNPYQVAEITVQDRKGSVVSKTRMTIPTSDEINARSATAPPRSGTTSRSTTDNRMEG